MYTANGAGNRIVPLPRSAQGETRAAERGRSTEAEIRAILEEAVRPAARLKIGSALAAFGKSIGGLDLDISRDPEPLKPARFE